VEPTADAIADAIAFVARLGRARPGRIAQDRTKQRGRHLQLIVTKGGTGWQKAPGYDKRARVEVAIGRYGPEPHVGLQAPELRPHRITSRRDRVIAAVCLICAPRSALRSQPDLCMSLQRKEAIEIPATLLQIFTETVCLAA
jgi:hypothetical protein